MKSMTRVISILAGTDELSEAFISVLHKADVDVNVDIDRVILLNDYGSATLVPNDNAVEIESSNLHGSRVIINDPVSALLFALYRLNLRLDVEDEDQIGVLPTGYPVLPEPRCTFADHSAKAYTKEQMLEYARDAVVRFTGMAPFEIEADPVPFDDMYKEHAVEWCDTCGGQIGDDCSCEDEEGDEDEEWEDADCEHCGCTNCDCDIDEDSICSKCHSASCQCLPDFDGQEDPEQVKEER
ncbi:hypothetical protein JA13_254 [Dickeya phage vB_DsoM_JA13]|uniref:Uncharacterized protein n=1 Tax=Dickeya phage vB_DsoM_JA13 TaxID=2283030 RepID=A0A384ZWQ0_9CAUD|nr:hypothetical protein JA13_254 [Dickeya phage vB_DsoM_JA13]